MTGVGSQKKASLVSKHLTTMMVSRFEKLLSGSMTHNSEFYFYFAFISDK